jgi:hypothetical protein
MVLYKLGTLDTVLLMKIEKPFYLEKKRKFMIKKFGIFKSLVLRALHQKIFKKNLHIFFDLIKIDPLWMRYTYVDKLFIYISNNLDIVNEIGNLAVICKNKLQEFNSAYNNRFLKNSYNLYYTCNYNNELCTQESSSGFYLCKKHLMCRYKRESKIQEFFIPTLHNNLIDIIIKYDMPIAYS